MKPFLLLATRIEDDAADDEYAAFLRHGGLNEGELVRHRLERDPMGDLDPGDWSGIMVGGSPFNCTDPLESKSEVQLRVEREFAALLDQVVARDTPFLGACYGIGTLGIHQGAVVDRTYGEAVGAVPISLTDAGRDDQLLKDVPEVFEAFVGHKEAVSALPAHALLLASSPTCPVQMFRIGENVYATQFHPELDIDGLCTRIDVYKHAGYFPPEEAESVKAAARASQVRYPHTVLRSFVTRYAR